MSWRGHRRSTDTPMISFHCTEIPSLHKKSDCSIFCAIAPCAGRHVSYFFKKKPGDSSITEPSLALFCFFIAIFLWLMQKSCQASSSRGATGCFQIIGMAFWRATPFSEIQLEVSFLVMKQKHIYIVYMFCEVWWCFLSWNMTWLRSFRRWAMGEKYLLE